jgi:hypothetical protein
MLAGQSARTSRNLRSPGPVACHHRPATADADGKRIWRIEVHIEAGDDEAEAVAERLGAAICPDAHHPGYCPVPWSISTSRATGRAAKHWTRYFREERAAAAACGDLPPRSPSTDGSP